MGEVDCAFVAEMWHYKSMFMGSKRVTEREALELARELPAEKGNFIGFMVGDDTLRIERLGHDIYCLKTSSPSRMRIAQREVGREKMLEVLRAFLAGSDIGSMCEWKNRLREIE